MNMIKKILLGVSSGFTTAIAPVVTLTSCNKETQVQTNSYEWFAFKQLHEVVPPHEYVSVDDLDTANKIYFDDVKNQNLIFVQDLVLSFNDNWEQFSDPETRFTNDHFLHYAYYYKAEIFNIRSEENRVSMRINVKYRPSIFSTEDENREAILDIYEMPYSSYWVDAQRWWTGASKHLMIAPKYVAANDGEPSYDGFANDSKWYVNVSHRRISDGRQVESANFNHTTISDAVEPNWDQFVETYINEFLVFDSYYSMFIQPKLER